MIGRILEASKQTRRVDCKDLLECSSAPGATLSARGRRRPSSMADRGTGRNHRSANRESHRCPRPKPAKRCAGLDNKKGESAQGDESKLRGESKVAAGAKRQGRGATGLASRASMVARSLTAARDADRKATAEEFQKPGSRLGGTLFLSS